MNIKADEISKIIREQIGTTRSTWMSPRSAASCRSATASPACMASRTRWRARSQISAWCSASRSTSRRSVGAVLLGEFRSIKKAISSAHWPHHLGAGRRGTARPRGQRSASPSTAGHRDEAVLAHRTPGARRRRSARRARALQTGLKAIDSMVPVGPRSARAHHRRPADGQDRRRHRRHPEPEGRRHLHLRDRPEAVRWPGREDARKPTRCATPSSSLRPSTRANCFTSTYSACTFDVLPRQRRHALVIYDDLSKHAQAYREISSSSDGRRARGIPRRRVLPALGSSSAQRS